MRVILLRARGVLDSATRRRSTAALDLMVRTNRRWLAITIGPMLIVAVYLVLSRWPVRWFSSWSDYVALGIAVSLGALAIISLNITVGSKILLLVIYVPIVLTILVYFSMVFVCGLFGDCL